MAVSKHSISVEKFLPLHSRCPTLHPSTSVHTTDGYSCVQAPIALYHGAPTVLNKHLQQKLCLPLDWNYRENIAGI